MAEEEDDSGKTEEPSQKKLEEARKKGEVVVSREISHWFMILAGTLFVAMMAGPLMHQVGAALLPMLTRPHDLPVANAGEVGAVLWIALKAVLLNQKVLAGLGNRDADESMWLAGIDPRRAPVSLAPDEIARLHGAIGEVLREGLELRGTQADLFGRPGQARHRRNVFERTGQPCPRCGTPIAHLRITGRNTHFCPHCQR